MHSVIIGKRQIDFPSEWKELNGDQLVEISRILHSRIERSEAIARILMVLMEMRKQSLWIRFAWAFRVTREFKYDCLAAAEWVLSTDYDCTDNKLPIVRSRKGYNLYGPLRECRRFVFIEFIEAYMAYLDFRKHFDDPDKRTEALDRLFIILYRDKNPHMPTTRRGSVHHWNGDPRCEYNGNVLDYRLREAEYIPIGYKYAALMFYQACYMRWEHNHPNIFKKAEAQSASSGGGNLAGALKSLAGGSLNIDKMMKVNASAALRDLDDRIAEAEEMEAKSKKR